MGWIKDNNQVRALYLGRVEVQGRVTESRVRYGGKVCYTLQLNSPVMLPWRSEPTDVVIVDEQEILEETVVAIA